MSDHTVKDKKREILKRNRRNQMIFSNEEEHRQVQEAGYWATPPIETSAPTESRSETGTSSAMDRMTMVRNRLTGRKAAAIGRWNRFAATSSSGGHGR